MTAEHIRDKSYGCSDAAELFLREIAAQLAELNDNLKEVVDTIKESS